MAVLRPRLDELDRLAEPLNDGELRVARKLAELDDSWTVYIQPRIGMERPDFVAVHDRFGVCAIEVKDWAYGKYRQAGDGSIEYTSGGVWRRCTESPRYQAYRYRSTIFQQYFARNDAAPTQQVRAALIMLDHSTAKAQRLFALHHVTQSETSVPVYGGEVLNGSIDEIVRSVRWARPEADAIARLRRELEEAAVTAELRAPMQLSPDARNIASNPSNARRRRVRGPAGCGKSFGLTARAAALAAEGQRVLVLSYNQTLSTYLRTLVTAHCRDRRTDPGLVTCTHFHGFLTRVIEDAHIAGFPTAQPGMAPWPEGIVLQAGAAFQSGYRIEPYDAVLVDEGQDFTLDWWNLLRHHVVRPDGEMLLVADPTQDVYGQRAWTDEERMLGSGFSGPWTELKGSYRLPSDLVPIVNEFARRYLPGERIAAEVPVGQPELIGAQAPTIRHWENIARSDELGTAIGREVIRLLRSHPDLAPSDVVFLCESHQQGIDAVRVIEAAGHPVHHIFANGKNAKTAAKRRFRPDAPGVKGCTVHSFKGWESRALVTGIGRNDNSRRLAYVAMTRVVTPRDGRPAYLSIVNSDTAISRFDSTFRPWTTLAVPLWEPPSGPQRPSTTPVLSAG